MSVSESIDEILKDDDYKILALGVMLKAVETGNLNLVKHCIDQYQITFPLDKYYIKEDLNSDRRHYHEDEDIFSLDLSEYERKLGQHCLSNLDILDYLMGCGYEPYFYAFDYNDHKDILGKILDLYQKHKYKPCNCILYQFAKHNSSAEMKSTFPDADLSNFVDCALRDRLENFEAFKDWILLLEPTYRMSYLIKLISNYTYYPGVDKNNFELYVDFLVSNGSDLSKFKMGSFSEIYKFRRSEKYALWLLEIGYFDTLPEALRTSGECKESNSKVIQSLMELHPKLKDFIKPIYDNYIKK